MKKRIPAWILSIVMIFSLLLPVSAASVGSGTQTVHVDRIVHAAEEFFIGHEGDYGTVVPADSGAVSLGKLGWHGARALYLLKMIVKKNPSRALSLLGSALYNEITNAAESCVAWNNRTLTGSEAAKVSALLVTAEGMRAQDELAYQDISVYISYAWQAGVRSDAAIFYYCTIENQYGHGGAQKFMRYVRQTLGISESQTINSLESFHNAVRKTNESYIQNYIGYRNKTYNYIVDLGWDITGAGENCPGGGFLDMPADSNWAHNGIDYAVSHGLFEGVSTTAFRPDGSMTRAMLVTVLYRLAGSPAVQSTESFPDVVGGTWYADAVYWAVGEGITVGFEDGTFRPDSYVNREQIATFLYRFAQSRGSVSGEASLWGFYDIWSVGEYAKTPLSWAVANGYIAGIPDGGRLLLNPKGNATRAQVAVILMRYCMGG